MMVPAGIFWVNSKITSDKVSPETFTTWYDGEHVPDILRCKGMKSAYRYQSIDPSAERPYLLLYPVKDMGDLESPDFKSIPTTSDLFPGPTHRCFDYADFDTRHYELIDSYEKEGTRPGMSFRILIPSLFILFLFTGAETDYSN